MIRLLKSLTFLSLPLALGLSGLASAFTDIPSYKLKYKVLFKGTSLGELQISVKNQGDQVVVFGETFPNTLASLIGDGKVVEIIEYKKTDDGLRLAKVTEKKGRDLSKISIAEVSPAADRIELKNGESYNISPSEQVDAYTFPFLSLLGLHDSKAGEKERVVSTKRVRQYTYEKAVREQLTVPAGTFATLRTRKSRSDSSKSISIWVTESQPRFPVKIEVIRKGKKEATISLLSKEG